MRGNAATCSASHDPSQLKHQHSKVKKLRDQAEVMMAMVIKKTSKDEREAFELFLHAHFVQKVRDQVDVKAALAALTGIEGCVQRRDTDEEPGGTHTKT